MSSQLISIFPDNSFPLGWIASPSPQMVHQKENPITKVAKDKIHKGKKHAHERHPVKAAPAATATLPVEAKGSLQLTELRKFISQNPPLYPQATQYYPTTQDRPAIFYFPSIGYYALNKTLANSANKNVYEVVDINTGASMALALIAVTSQNTQQVDLEKYYHNKFSLADPKREYFVAGNPADFLIGQQLNTAFLMPLMKGGDVGKYLKKHPETTAKQKMKMFIYMLKSIQIMHKEGIRHGDIKKENYLIGNHFDHPKISDFGTCSHSNPGVAAAPNDPKIRSPEFVRYGGLGTGRKADIWALGVTVAEMFGATEQDTAKLTQAVNAMDDAKIDQTVLGLANQIAMNNFQAAQLIQLCLRVDQHQRPDIDGLIAKAESLLKDMA